MLYIIDENIDRMGGVERIISILANYFINQRDVTMVSILSMENSFFEYDKRVKKIYFSKFDQFSKNDSNKKKYLFLIKKIIHFCRSLKDDDVVIFGRVPVAAKFLPFIKNKPKIIVRDAINLYDYSKIIKRLMLFYFPKKVSTLIVSSEESIKLYNEFFKDKKINYKKIYNPLGITVPKNLSYNFDNKLIVSNGRFDKQKGFELLLEACKIVFKKHNDWKLKLIGDGPLKHSYETIIDCDELRNNVELVPSIKNIVLGIKQASIYVMTSRFEGYANSLVEAEACGIPCITYDWLTGCDEIINDKINGEIVHLIDREKYYFGFDNQTDINNLAKVIISFIENKDKCKKYSKNSKKILESRSKNLILDDWNKLIK